MATALNEPMPELAAHERVRTQKLKSSASKNAQRQDVETLETERDEQGNKAPKEHGRRERGPNKAGRLTKPSHVSMAKRLQEYPEHHLKVSGGERSCSCDCVSD